jgi:DNA modification methylase
VIWGDDGEVSSFADRWSGGMDHYVGWLKERIEEIWRTLKKTGSLYVHCDWHADAYIRVHILEKLGGVFVNNVVWKRTNAHNDAKRKLPIIIDTIFIYSKGNDFTYTPIYGELKKEYIENFYKYEDEKGVYRLDNLANTRFGGYNYAYKGYKPNSNGWRCPLKKMEELDRAGLLKFPKSPDGRIVLKRYLDDSKGTLQGNLWDDIPPVGSRAKERIGYPTQKPLTLMERIIKASSNEGDVVLDAFCGGGTTLVAAQKLNRNFIGIDQSVRAIAVSQARLEKSSDLFSLPFTIEQHKYNRDHLLNMDAFKFEQFILLKHSYIKK